MTAILRRHGRTATLPGFLCAPAARQRFRRRLLAWYEVHARDLPWRKTSDPYLVWVSEVMLQQTQVATVEEYYRRFVSAFPTLEALAAADEQQVLRHWEGLGYYRRARQLHAAARQCVAEHGGRLPNEAAELTRLPGIGRYTAGAIASMAFGRRAPILEANTVRLWSRLVGYREDPTAGPGQALLWSAAEAILPRKDVARFNQALMELGSLVCRPKEPLCDACPVSAFCAARQQGLVAEIPRAKAAVAFTALREAAVVVRKNGGLLMRRCGEGERWAGLWDFPRFAVESEAPHCAANEIAAKVRQQTGIACGPLELITTIKHGVTRYRITLDCYEATYVGGRIRCPTAATGLSRWIPIGEMAELPLSTTGRKLARLVGAGEEVRK